MPRKYMWMGPKGFETWVRAPRISPNFSRKGYSRTASFRNGGITVQNSVASHKEYEMTLPLSRREDVETLTAMSEGVFGDELIYWLDPMAMDRNLASQMWATPSIAAYDGVPIFQDQEPSLVENSHNPATRYPRYSALYRATGVSEKLYVPISPGHRLWIGAHGEKTGAAGIQVAPMKGLNVLPAQTLTMLGMSTPTLVNTSFSAADGYTGVEVSAIETGLLRNLAPNPGNEVSLAGTSAIGGTGGSPVLTRHAGGHSGGYAARVTYGSTATVAGGGIAKIIPVEQGVSYSFGEFYRASKATLVQGTLEWMDKNGSVLGTGNTAGVVTTAAPNWSAASQLTFLNRTAPTGAVNARFRVRSVAGTGYDAWTAGDWLEVDDMQVNTGATLQGYTDGNSAGWYWTGAPGESVSAQTPDSLTFGALVVFVLPEGATPRTGRFSPGQGHGGCRFNGEPEQNPYNLPLDLAEVSFKLLEVGPWE